MSSLRANFVIKCCEFKQRHDQPAAVEKCCANRWLKCSGKRWSLHFLCKTGTLSKTGFQDFSVKNVKFQRAPILECAPANAVNEISRVQCSWAVLQHPGEFLLCGSLLILCSFIFSANTRNSIPWLVLMHTNVVCLFIKLKYLKPCHYTFFPPFFSFLFFFLQDA